MAKLTSRGRKRLRPGSFAVPARSRVGGKGKAKYPIHDKAHARNALARVSQHGSAAEQRMVRAAVHRRYPSIGKTSKTKRKR